MVTEELLCVCINPVSCMMGNDNKTQLSCRCKQVHLSTWSLKSDAPEQDGAVRHPGLTLLWYPEGFCVSRHHLMHDSTELIQHLQALLLPHAGVVESWESWLKRRQGVRRPSDGLNTRRNGGVALMRSLTFVASVRMSLESFTRHCSGTVTSMTFALSCFLLLSVTNLPYQALRMMRPGLMKQH